MPKTKRRPAGESSVVVIGVSAARMSEMRALLKGSNVTNFEVRQHVPRLSRRLTEAFNRGKQKALAGAVALPMAGTPIKGVKHAPRPARDYTVAFESGKQKALGNLKKKLRR